MSDTPRVGIEVSVDGSGVEAGLARVDAAVTRTGRTLDTLGDRGGAALDEIGTHGASAAGRVDAATRSMVNSIQRTTAAVDAGSRSTREYYEALARQRGINTEALRPYLQQLEEVTQRQAAARAGLDATSGSLGNVGQSAAQTQAALRGVPAQITDIITSIQGGQAPLTVFLQQGGQLRDMFGGAGAAARALGSTVLGMISPLTVAAAAALALGVAYNEGSKEADAYNRSLILTGNAAATTAGELADMARAISNNGGTQGDAAAALAALAGTGDVAAGNLQRFGEVAVRAQKSIGISVDETAQAFADLAESPLAASEKLNQQYRYLTVAVYDQIKALEEQGRTEEAAEVAQNAYADAMDDRAKAIKANLGTIESAWAGLTGVAKKAWDSMLNIGREDTLQEKLSDVAAQIAEQQKKLYNFIDAPQARARIAELRTQQGLLQDQVREQNKANEAQAASNAREQAGIELSKEAAKYLDKETQRQNELAGARTKAAAALSGASEDRVKEIQAQLKSIEAGINEKYADKSKANASAIKAEASAYATLVTAVEERIAQTAREAAGLKPMTDSQKLQVALDESLASGKLKLTAAHKAEYEAKIRSLAANESVIQSQKRAAQGQAEVEKLFKSLADERKREIDAATREAESNERVAASYGLTKLQIEELTLARLEDQYAQRTSGELRLEDIEHLRTLIDLKKRSVEALKEVDSREVAAKSAKEAEEAWKRTAANIEESLTDALMRGFESGKSFAENLRDATVNMFQTMILRPTIQAALQPMTNSLASVFQAGGGGGSSFGSAMDLISIGKTIYSGFTGGMAASMGSYITQFGNMFGSQAISAFGTGMGLTTAQAGAAATAYGGTSTAVGGGLASGASFANAIPVIGWIISGMMASNSLYKQGWDYNNGSVNKLGQNLGSGINLVDQFARALGFSNSTANIISGLAPVSKLFGRKNPEITEKGIEGTISPWGVASQNYAKVLEKGGVFRSDKNYILTAEIVGEQDALLDKTMQGIMAATRSFADALGEDASAIYNYTKLFKVVLTGDEAKDQELISQMFAGVADDLANLLVPSIARFSAEGEAASATLQRLAVEFTNTNAIMQALGVDGAQAFGAVGVASMEARERLMALAGGVDALATQTTFFAQNFLTEAEQMAPVQKAVAEQMAALGYASVTTNEQFKALVMGLASSGALATEAGSKNYAQLLALAPQFKAVADYVKGIEDARAAEELAALTAAQEAAQESARNSLSDFISKMEDFATTVASLNDSLVLGELSTLTPEQQYAEARRQFELTRQAALAGDTTAQGNLDSVEQAFLQISQRINGGDAQYASDLATVMRTNDELATWATNSVDVAQASLDALNDQNTTLTGISDILASIAQGVQYLPAALSGEEAPAFTQAFATIDYSSYGAAQNAALVAEIKALREEVKGLRADAARQTGDKITATAIAADQAADKIVAGTKSAMVDGAWRTENATRVPV